MAGAAIFSAAIAPEAMEAKARAAAASLMLFMLFLQLP
jgi:hypothetical protein